MYRKKRGRDGSDRGRHTEIQRQREQGDGETYGDGETEERPRMRGKHRQAVEGAGEPQIEGSRK